MHPGRQDAGLFILADRQSLILKRRLEAVYLALGDGAIAADVAGPENCGEAPALPVSVGKRPVVRLPLS